MCFQGGWGEVRVLSRGWDKACVLLRGGWDKIHVLSRGVGQGFKCILKGVRRGLSAIKGDGVRSVCSQGGWDKV